VRRTGGRWGTCPTSRSSRASAARLDRGPVRRDRGRGHVATLKQLLERGQIDPDAETVLYNTGDGLKTLDARGGGRADGDDRAVVLRVRRDGSGLA
jgi:threonine synthase